MIGKKKQRLLILLLTFLLTSILQGTVLKGNHRGTVQAAQAVILEADTETEPTVLETDLS